MSYRRLTAALSASMHWLGLHLWRSHDRAHSRRQIKMGALVALVLMASLAIPAGPAEAMNPKFSPTDIHTIDANDSSQRVLLAIQDDGTLGIRRDLNDGNKWSSIYDIGDGPWATGNAAILGNGDIHVVAVNNSNELHTAIWPANGDLGSLSLLTNGVASTTVPALAANSNELALAVVGTNGRLNTRRHAGAWSGPTDHYGNWVHVDVDLAEDGDLWFAGTKTDKTLKIRKQLNGSWSGIANMGVATWNLDAPPSISAGTRDVIFSAVKDSGRLYTRSQIRGKWQPWVKHGVDTWVSADVAVAENGGVWIAGLKNTGRLYTRPGAVQGTWGAWKDHGSDTWSTTSSPAIALKNNGRPTFHAVKADGRLYLRSKFANNWSGWVNMGDADWVSADEVLPPQWVHGSTISIEAVSMDDFTISWGPLVGGAQSPDWLELTLYDSNGNPDPFRRIFHKEMSEYVVRDYHGGELVPAENYFLSLVAVNSAGKSDPIELADGGIPLVSIEALDITGGVGSLTAANALGSAANAETSAAATASATGDCYDAWAGPEGSEFGVLLPGAVKSFVLKASDGEIITVPVDSRHYLYLGTQGISTEVCHRDGRITQNDRVIQNCISNPRLDHVLRENVDFRMGTPGESRVRNAFDCTIDLAFPGIREILDVQITMTIEQTLSVVDGELVANHDRDVNRN